MEWVPPRITIVATSPALRYDIEELLRHFGYDVVEAASPATARELGASPAEAMLLVDAAGPSAAEVEHKPALLPMPGLR